MPTDWNEYKPVETPAAGGTDWSQFKPAATSAAPAAPKRTLGETVKDTALGVAQGAVNLLSGVAEGDRASSPTGMVRNAVGLVRRLNPNLPLPEVPDTTQLAMRAAEAITGRQLPRATLGEATAGVTDAITRNLSPALQEDKQALADADGFVDSARQVLSRPRLLGQFVAEQVPNLVTIGTGARASAANAGRMALTRALTGGAARDVAEATAREAGKKAAERFIAVANAGMESGPAALQAQQEAMNLPDEIWEQNEAYRAMRAQGIEAGEAKRTLANEASLLPRLVGLAAGYVGGKVSAPFEADVFTGQIAGGARSLLTGAGVRRTLAGAGKEAAEEVVQEGGSQFGTNLGVRTLDPSRSLMEGVPEAAGTAAVVGGVLGGGMNVVGTVASRQAATDPAAPPAPAEPPPLPPPLPDMGQREAMLRESLASAAPEEQPAAYARLVEFLEANGRMLGQEPITVASDGTAITPEQGTAPTDGWEVSRPAVDLTPDVRTAQTRHPGFPLPDPANGPLSRAVNEAAGMGALASQQPVTLQALRNEEAGGDAAPAQAAEPPGNVDPATGELVPFSREQTKFYLAQQATNGRMPESKMIAKIFGMKPREASELRREVMIELKAQKEADRAAATQPISEASNVATTTGSDAVGAQRVGVLDAGGDTGRVDAVAGAAGGEVADGTAARAAETTQAAAPAPDAQAGSLTYDDSEELLDSDITPPSGGPFTQRGAADAHARRHAGGRVFEVEGGFVVRTPSSSGFAATAESESATRLAPTGTESSTARTAQADAGSQEIPASEVAASAPSPAAADVQMPPAKPTDEPLAPGSLESQVASQTALEAPASAGRGRSRAQATPSTAVLQPKSRVINGKRTYIEHAPETLAAYFQPGRIVRSYGGHDRVVAFHPPANGQGWRVEVEAVDDAGNPLPASSGTRNGIRSHSTMPTQRDLRAVLGEPQAPTKAKKSGTAKKRTADAATEEDRAASEGRRQKALAWLRWAGYTSDTPMEDIMPAVHGDTTFQVRGGMPATGIPQGSVRVGGVEDFKIADLLKELGPAKDEPTPQQRGKLRQMVDESLERDTVINDSLPGKLANGVPDAEIRVAKTGSEFVNKASFNTGTTGAGGPWNIGTKYPTAEAAQQAAVEWILKQLPTKNVAPGEQARIDGIRAWLAKRTPPAGGGQTVADAAAAAATSPTNDIPLPSDAQKEAGNYAKGHIRIDGLDISIENPAGSRRRPQWPPLKFAYGYVKGTIGKDKDHVDVFLSDDATDTSLPVFVIDQNNRDGGFDEHKVMIGFRDEAAARAGYLANYTKGWTGLGGITEMPWDGFKAWVRDPAKTKRRAATPARASRPAADAAPQGALFSRPDQTSTPEFRRWFGGSKVVDAKGEPLVVYHGTDADFDAFELSSIGSNFGADDRGFFFTSSPVEASDYAENDTIGINKREGANVIPAYVSLKKPLVIDPAFLEREGMGGILGDGGSEDTISFWDNYQQLIHEWAGDRKSDGVIVVDPSFTEANGEPRRLVVAFRPNQIKSATGNAGSFDPKDPSILASRPDRSLNGATEAFKAARDARVLSRAQVQAFIAPVTTKWGSNAPKVVVLESAEGLPQFVKADPGYATAEGFFDDRSGTVYLIAPNIRPGYDTVQKRNVTARERAISVLVHEAVGHFGMETITGRSLWGQLEETVERMRASGRHADLFAQIDRRYRGANRTIATREAIAVMAEKGVRNSVIDRAISALRRFLRDTLGMNLRFSEAELRQHLVAAARYVRGGARPRMAPAPAVPEAFASRPDEDMEKGVKVTILQGGKFGPVATNADRVRARDAARLWLEGMRRDHRTFTNADTGWKIGLSRTGVQELLYWTARPERIEALAALPSLIRNGVLATSVPNAAPPRADVADAVRSVHTFYAPLRIAGETRIARLVVKETVNGNFAYDLQQSEVLESEGPVGDSPRAPDTKSGAWATTTGPSEMTIADVRAAVNADRRPEWRWSNPGSVTVSVDARGNKTISDGANTYVKRGERFYLAEGSQPRDFLSLGDARAEARRLGMEVLYDDPTEGQRPTWSVVVPEVMAREAMVGERFFSQPDTVASTVDAAAKGPDASVLAALKGAFRSLKPENLRENTRPAWLGALALRHLAELGNDLKLAYVGQYADRVAAMSADRNVMQEEAGKVADAWETFQRKNRAGADAMANLMHDATLQGVDPAREYAPLQHATTRRGPAEPVTAESIKRRRALIEADLREQRSEKAKERLWGEIAALDQLWEQERDRRAAYPGLVQRWNALPEQGRALYLQARDAYVAQSDRMEQALIDRIQALEADERMKAAMIGQIRQNFESARVAGPYFPLQRFGEFWISATDRAGEPFFSLYESVQAWREAQADLKAQGYTGMKAGRKLDEARSLSGASGGFMADLQNLLETAGVKEDTRDEVYQLYLRTLPELSVRKHQIHRKGIAGYSGDALRAFSANLFHGSFQIARLKHTHELEADLLSMKKDVDGLAESDPEAAAKAAALYSEMNLRHDWVMNPRDSGVVNTLTGLGFGWYLGTTPAAALVNLTQTAIVTFPVLAAKHGVAKAATYLSAAMGRALRNADGNLVRGLSDEERAAFKVWYDSGAIEKTQSHALAGLSETDTRMVNPYRRRAMEVMSFLFHRAEVVNREATALAAFRLAREAGQSFNEATQYASDVIWESHFDYSNANRARWVQSNAAKVLLLFRQYSMNMTWFLWRNLYQSIKGESPQVKKEARTKLAGVLGMTSLFSGALGMPLTSVAFGLANAAAAAFGDDDEPFDAETEFRNFLADMLGPDLGRIVARGPVDYVTGLGFSGRVGLNDLWLRDPDRDLSGKEQANYLLEQAAGPLFGGMLVNTLRGISMVNEGHTWRGIETMMPKILKDGMKAIRYGTEGVNTLRGDPVIEDLSVGRALLQAAGFSPAALSERYDGINAAKRYEERVLARRESLLNAYAMAWRASDAEGVAEVMGKIRAFNLSQPTIAINTATIRRSLQSRLRYSSRAEGGVVINPKVEGRAREQARFAE